MNKVSDEVVLSVVEFDVVEMILADVVNVMAVDVILDDEAGPLVVVAPSTLPGIAEPTPWLVKGVGIGNTAVSGLSAGS